MRLQGSEGKIIVFSAPSGAGKTAVKNSLMKKDPTIVFAISATTRKKREGEKHEKDYYFITEEEFKAHIANDAFIEYDYHFGNYYGTMRMAVEADLKMGAHILMDVDVNGALNVKKYYKDQAVLIFINPPSLEELRRRLESRGTESPESLELRLSRAKEEMEKADHFDHIVINDDVERAATEILEIIRKS